jgi:hypothetical protein
VITKGKNTDDLGVASSIPESDPRWQLAERVSRSSVLYRATQLRDMLLFIVRQTILNPDQPIHESEIAHKVLGRRSDFNPLDDNIVRVQMAHLRKKLDLYFSTDGKHEEVVITVALGTYKPLFTQRSQMTIVPVIQGDADAAQKEDNASGDLASRVSPSRTETIAQDIEQPSAHRWNMVLSAAAALVILALAALSATLWVRLRNEQQTYDAALQLLSPWKNEPAVSELWSNFFDTSRDTDVVLSDNSYLLLEQISKQPAPLASYLNRSYIDQLQAKTADPASRFVEGMIATKSLGNISEFKLAQRIMALDPSRKNLHLYSARQYMPALVKQDNVILIGGEVSNPWVELFENRLNFIENTKFEGYGITTVTNRSPASGEPSLYTSTDAVGYCVVAFLPNPGQDGKVLLIEGTSAEATEAAGDFLSGQQFSAFRGMIHSARLPYFEILLKTSQVRGTPLTVTVEAYRTYPTLQ